MTMFTFADTTTMPFDELPTNPGLKFQLLWKDPPTGSTVQMSYGPPGFSSTIVEMLSHGPHRHYHRNVNERHYILGGDYPIWHWPNDRDEGTMTILRRHTFLENPAKTLHGLRPETTPEIATQLLVWNNGSGTGIFEKNAEKETVEVPLDGPSRSDVEWASPRILSTKDLIWRQHPSIEGWKIKDVAGAEQDCPPVVLVSIPPGATARAAPDLRGADRRWFFVLSGDLSLIVETSDGTSQRSLQEGHFLAWLDDTRLTYPAGAMSDGGCVSLCVGHDLASQT
jgi:hypothetical protein